MSEERLLADGRERLLADPDLQVELDLAVAEIEAKYAPLLEEAGFFRGLRLRRQMKREIEREIFKGEPPRRVVILTGSGDGDCGYPFEVGEAYLVYGYRRGVYHTSICSRTNSVHHAAEEIRTLRQGGGRMNGE